MRVIFKMRTDVNHDAIESFKKEQSNDKEVVFQR